MSNYTKPTISGYNTNPPPDDASTGADNQLFWSKHKTKLADPIKTLLDSVNDQCDAAFEKLFLYAVTSVTSTSSVSTSSRDKLIKTTNGITLTLPSAASAGDGFAIAFYNSDSSATLTIDGNSSETINGSLTASITAGGSAILVCDGTNWSMLLSQSSVEVGDIIQSFKSSKSGYLLMQGQTIGSSASAASASSDAYESLFEFCWDTFSDTICPVSSGRGASAAADWAANKTLTLVDGRGRVLLGKDNMGGASADVVTNAAADTLGGTEGSEDHTLTGAQSGTSAHSHSEEGIQAGGSIASGTGLAIQNGSTGTSAEADASEAHPNMQPYITVNTFIKY